MRAQYETMSDEALASRIARDAPEGACVELYSRYQQRIYLWCYNYTHEMEDAVDLAQEIFVKLFKSIDQFAGRSRFSTWAYQITRNHCLGELAKQRRKWWKRMTSIDESDTLQIADQDVYRALDAAADLQRIIASAGDVMTQDELDAFVLHYGECLTVREITAILKCANVTGARTLIQNARRKFKRMIDEKGFRDER